jgi:hypothetical protein
MIMAEVLKFERRTSLSIEIERLMQLAQPRNLLENRRYRILCVGNDPELLCTRCAVLSTVGYKTEWATPAETKQALDGHVFQLVILCMTLSAEEGEWIRAVVPHGPKFLEIEHLIMPVDLLCVIGHLLQRSSDTL